MTQSGLLASDDNAHSILISASHKPHFRDKLRYWLFLLLAINQGHRHGGGFDDLMAELGFGDRRGITEFLPISSTGHLILASWLLGLSRTEFQKSFEIAIQLGAIASVIMLYWRRFLDVEILKKIAVAFLPTGIIGLALYRVVKTHLLGSEEIVIWALGLGGVALIVFELLHREGKNAVTDVAAIPYSKALLVGLFQTISIIPGVSRAGATILGGLFVGLSRPTIVEFSFLLAVPTMLAATGYDLLKDHRHFLQRTPLT